MELSNKSGHNGQFDSLWQYWDVYITDRCNHRIQVFTAEGKFLRMFGKSGVGKGKLKQPYGVAIDSNDRVYVSEWDNNCVSIFTSECQFVTSLAIGARDQDSSTIPSQGLAVDNGVVFVCEENCNHVQLFWLFTPCFFSTEVRATTGKMWRPHCLRCEFTLYSFIKLASAVLE